MNSNRRSRWLFSELVEWRGRLLVVVLMTILFLGAVANLAPISFGHVAGKTYQGWAATPPTINGEILPSEWQSAGTASFTITIGANSYAGTFYVMNDATNLYVGLKIVDDDFDTGGTPDGFAIYFDNDNDGTFESGDDGLGQIADATGFIDRVLQTGPMMMKLDTELGGTTDGSGACAGHGGSNHFELSHPLNSTDDAHDFSLSPLNTVGFTLLYLDGPVGQEYWPAPASADATGWGDIVITSAPPTMTAWASTAATIDGVVEAAEWASASHSPISIGWTYTGEMWMMNDANNLYVAVKIADSSLTASDMLWMSFDNNNDGSFVAGDDLLAVYGNSHFYDAFWAPGPPATLDTSDGGTSDGEGASSGSGGFNYFEFSHPLDSSDNAHDFSLSAGNTVGFSLQYIEASGYWADWPSHNEKSWAHITVASAPVPTPDFSIACAPASVSVAQGSSITSTCTVTSLNAFSAAVDLSGSWVGVAPGDVGAVLPTPITPLSGGVATSTLTISAGPGASIGPFTYRVTATSGALIHTADVSVDITAGAADFTISASPSSLSLGPSTSGTSTITVQSTGIFSSPASLTSSGAPAGLNVVFGTNPVTPPPGGIATSVVTVSVAGAAAGSYPVTITGTSGALIHSSTLTVQVTTAGGGCLIATATYGSELSPEVQFLRNFRDRSILKTNTGSNFMIAFNAWYYSFSPTVAQFIREHATVGTAVKVMLYPLIGILRIGAEAFHLFPTNPEVSAVVSGFLVSSLIGITYATPPTAAVLAYSSRARRVAKRLQMPVLVVLLGALAAVAFVTEVGAPAILMMISTVAIVLASLTVTTLFASRAILRLAKRV